MDIAVEKNNAVDSAENSDDSLAVRDPKIYEAVFRELERQQNQIELIASENLQ